MSDAPRDWRLPENRREAFQRFYSFHLKYGTHPGCVYFWLPDIADEFELDDDQRAWLVWLNGNTQNPVMSLLLLEAAPHPKDWRKAVDFWNDNFKAMDWDTDRRHQKSKFGEATERWADWHKGREWSGGWISAGLFGWEETWAYARNHPYMGRLSAWSMTEYARILFGEDVPDAGTFLLEDLKGSNSHRNGLCVVAGMDAVYWKAGQDDGQYPALSWMNDWAEELLAEARVRNPGHPDVTRLTMESALCTYKSWHKPDRRYPNVYADMAYDRLRKAEARFGSRFQLLWDSRENNLPDYLRLEATPTDPGLCRAKQNHYLTTGQVPVLGHMFPDMWSEFDDLVTQGAYGVRKDS